jgi:hypothetical protein
MGPLIPSIIGFIGLISTYLFISSNITLYLYSFFIMYSMHIINLMPFGGDGKNIVLALLKMKFQCH